MHMVSLAYDKARMHAHPHKIAKTNPYATMERPYIQAHSTDVYSSIHSESTSVKNAQRLRPRLSNFGSKLMPKH